eukprot:3211024-Prymnesium_polylepis.1
MLRAVTLLLLSASGCCWTTALRWRPQRAQAARHESRRVPPSVLVDSSEDVADPEDQTSFFASLRARQVELQGVQEQLEKQWRSAKCESKARLVLDDWVRRLALSWPLVAVGTARGSVVVADLSSGAVVCEASEAHPSRAAGDEEGLRLIHGEYDGGGLIAIAFNGATVVLAGRDGGARLWRLATSAAERPATLDECGCIPGDALVSAIHLESDGGAAWVVALDGSVVRWQLGDIVDGSNGADSPTATLRLQAAAAVLCLAVDEELGLIACGTADGGVEVSRDRPMLFARALTCPPAPLSAALRHGRRQLARRVAAARVRRELRVPR